MARRILWVVPKWPLPAHDGSRLATVELVRELARDGELDLLALVGEGETADAEEARRELGVREVFVVRRPTTRGKWRLLPHVARRPGLPLTVAPYGTAGVRRAVAETLAGRRWRTLVFEGLHAAAAFPDVGRFAETTIYRAQNVERDLWARTRDTAGSPFTKALFAWQTDRVHRMERDLVRNVRAVAAITDEDRARFTTIAPGARVATVPMSFAFPSSLPDRVLASRPEFLYCGRLDWAPNRQGIEWLLEEVWPHVTGAVLTIVGNGEAAWLARYARLPGLRVEGYVPSTAPYFERAHALLVPVFIGSGVRVKMIEASARGLTCLSTALGARGTGLRPGEHFVIAETAGQWIAALRGFNAGGGQGRAAFHFLKDALSSRGAGERFRELIA